MSPKRLGMRIKGLRQEKGYTQEAFAKRARISRVYLAQIEGSATKAPIRTPSLPMLERLAKALSVKLTDLLE